MIYKSYTIENNLKLINDKKIFLFYGENHGLKKDFKKGISSINKSIEKINIFQDEILNDKNLLKKEIINKSLFNENKVIFIEQANDKILSFLNEIENQIQNEKIYIFSSILEKKSKLRKFFEDSNIYGICPCYEDTIITIKSIITKKLKGFIGLTPQIINLIIESAGLDRDKVNNEIDKIISCFEDKKIVQNKLEQLLNIKTNDDFEKLKDEALKGNKFNTNNLLGETVFNNEDNYFYISSINQRLMKLSTIANMKKENLAIDNIISQLKPPIFWKDKPTITDQAKKWNDKKINKALSKVYQAELKIKSNSNIRNDLLIKNLIVELCNDANDALAN